MNKRQAKKREKILEYRMEYDFLPLKTIKKYNRQYEAYFNSPIGRKVKARENMNLDF